jgi:hypothetical protein
MATADLLCLRLQALELDIEKVDGAVRNANQRSRFLIEARKDIEPCGSSIGYVEDQVRRLVKCINEDPVIARRLNSHRADLADDLRKMPDRIEELRSAVSDALQQVGDALAMTVPLYEQSQALEESLDRRCENVRKSIAELQDKVRNSTAGERGDRWLEYQALLDKVRPVFIEYVDFLGGLAVRDTGLDDQVCDMTDGLLTRFTGVTGRTLPLPARQAALGNALDSVVLLGFPEWSIWGIPLVGHEVGLAYAQGSNDRELASLIQGYVPLVLPPDRGDDSRLRAEEHVRHLFADVFATYTLGLAYACAALLLRLSPRADEPPDPGRPRDIDRARVITSTLCAGGKTAPDQGGEFTDTVDLLRRQWDGAVRETAGSARQDVPPEQPDRQDWIPEFIDRAIEYLRSRHWTIPPYDQERWRASDEWRETLRGHLDKEPDAKLVRPVWGRRSESVPDALNAAWRMRLDGTDTKKLADCVTGLWPGGQRGA